MSYCGLLVSGKSLVASAFGIGNMIGRHLEIRTINSPSLNNYCLFLSFGWENEIEWQPRDTTFIRDLTSYVLEWIDAGARWIGKFDSSTQCGIAVGSF